MDIILVHLGGKYPAYMQSCIKQIRKYTKDRIIVVVDSDQIVHFGSGEDIVVVQKNTLPANEEWVRFKKTNHFDQFCDSFWRYACERFYAIEAAMEMFFIDKALHLENDNLIYGTIDKQFFDNYCGKSVGITQITSTLSSAGVMYVGSFDSMRMFNKKMNDVMAMSRNDKFEKYGKEMQNEMRLMCIVEKENPGLITCLPIEPCFDSKYVYDCASWGQYVGGTSHKPGESYKTDAHIIGKKLIDGQYDISWLDGANETIPSVVSTKGDRDGIVKYTPIFNLHIHSKELERWM